VNRKALVPVAALALTASLALAACGEGPAAETAAPPAGTFPVEVEGTLIPAAPQRIVSAAASHTEILYAIEAGGQVVATDQFSDYPEEAAGTPKFDSFNLGVETVASFDPDLVILSFDPGDLQAGLAALGIPTLLLGPPVALEDVYGQIGALGQATGRIAEAERLIEEMTTAVEGVVTAIPAGAAITYYYELDPTLYSLTSRTFIGGLLARLGMQSIADAADDGSGYPQLSGEFILAADPDFILLADILCCGQSAASVAARPGWSSLAAVEAGRVVELDDDLAQRWGPRIVDLLREVAGAVHGGETG